LQPVAAFTDLLTLPWTHQLDASKSEDVNEDESWRLWHRTRWLLLCLRLCHL